ncbi:MAG: CinA family protein [Sphingopyxis sp.]|jgi:nicotinamide-nucleotide amidase|uniref:CinA family protein n=1 Tax=Sphingopyxis sp. TaxID=1908224 RepID=UPI0032EC796B
MADCNDLETLAAALLRAAAARNLRIATAESCSGGLIASLLTDIEGLGHVFERGFVTYSDEAKIEMLGVSRRLIESKGAVSAEVAAAMARGAISRSCADAAIAITGFAGPGGADDEEGLVHIAALCCGRSAAAELHIGAVGRSAVREAAARAALAMTSDLIARE